MTKASNLSADSGANDDRVDLQLALAQHLSGLKEFGVTILPAGRGQSFNIETTPASEPSVGSSDQTPAADLTQQAKPAPASASIKQSAPVADLTPAVPASTPATPASRAKPETLVAEDTPYSAPTAASEREAALKVIQQEVAGCTACPQLSDFRTNTVFGSGDPNARLVFLGEGPGEAEDLQGLPFQGAPGELFDKILLACGLKREQVYLLNTIKCRPPKNRNPKTNELENCWGYGLRQLDILQPEFICCMGSVAAKTLLKTNLSIGKLRKRFHKYRGSKVLVTYHPTYLLRTSSAKTHAWEDMKMLMNEMGIEIPKPKR